MPSLAALKARSSQFLVSASTSSLKRYGFGLENEARCLHGTFSLNSYWYLRSVILSLARSAVCERLLKINAGHLLAIIDILFFQWRPQDLFSWSVVQRQAFSKFWLRLGNL